MSYPTLTPEQENVIRLVLERNHTYYVAQGMSRPHMWPEELLSEITNELAHAPQSEPLAMTDRKQLPEETQRNSNPAISRTDFRIIVALTAVWFFIAGGLIAEALA